MAVAIGAIRAFVWLRWRLMANSLRGGRRRDTLEQVSRALAVFTPIILGVMLIGMVVATTFLAFVAARSAAIGLVEPPTVVLILRLALAAMVAVLVIVAIVVPSQATVTRYERLLLLPISRRVLHGVEVAASLADPWLVWMIPALLALAAGILLGGRVGAAAIAGVAAILFIALLVALNALIGFLVSWLVRDRRRSELFTLIFVIVISALSFLPALFAGDLEDRKSSRREEKVSFSAESFDRQLPGWTRALPTELYAHTVLAGMQRDFGRVGLGLAGLAAEFALLFWISAIVHARLLGMPEVGRRRGRRDATSVSIPSLPLLGRSSSAIAWAQARTALRSVRGRLMLVLSGPLVAVIVLVVTYAEPDEAWPAFLRSHGEFLVGVSGVFALYALQAFSMNLFGSDRAGLTLQFLQPISDAEIARGKIVGCLILLAPTIALSIVATLAVAPNGSPLYWLAAVLAVVATLAWLSPFAVWLSALFPQPADLSKTGSGGNPHPLPMLIGTLLVALLAAPAAGILVAGVFWLRQPWLTLGFMLAWLLLSAVVAFPLATFASRTIGARRENLVMVAQGK